MSVLYAAYGSNLHLGRMRHRCPGAQPVAAGIVRDHRLLFRRTADIEPLAGRSVPVGLFRLTRADEVSLDRYEGFPRVYGKTELAVQTAAGTRRAMFYVMNRLDEISPEEAYVQCIAEGYADWGFDPGPLAEALALCGLELSGQEMHMRAIRGRCELRETRAQECQR